MKAGLRWRTKTLYTKVENHCQTAIQIQQRILQGGQQKDDHNSGKCANMACDRISATSMLILTWCFVARGRVDEATEMQKKSEAMFVALLGADRKHQHLGDLFRAGAYIKRIKGQMKEAVADLEKAMAIFKEVSS